MKHGTFIKRPIPVQAALWEPECIPSSMPNWLWLIISSNPERFDQATGILTIRTLEGDMKAKPGCWIVQGVRGEVYPVDAGIFEETYEERREGIQ